MRNLIRRLLLAPLTVFNSVIKLYSLLLGLVHRNLQYAWADAQFDEINNNICKIKHPIELYQKTNIAMKQYCLIDFL